MKKIVNNGYIIGLSEITGEDISAAEKESITGKEFMKIFHEIKGIPEEETAEKTETSVNSEESLPGGSEEAIQEQEQSDV